LKSCPKEKIQSEIDYYIKTLGIEEKRKSFASTLSGGQKRKLSVGIALIGDSKVRNLLSFYILFPVILSSLQYILFGECLL